MRAAAEAQGKAGHVYTVRAGRPFLASLAEALLKGDLPVVGGARPDPLQLAGITLLLPTRRSVGALQAAFLTAGDGAALLLPRIRPITESADDIDFLTSVEDMAASVRQGSARVVGQLERQLALAKLVFQWVRNTRGEADSGGRAATSPAQAALLAKELGVFMDMLESEGVGAQQLVGLVPEELSEHWKETLHFLKIVTEYWPLHLAGAGLMSPVEHRKRMLRAEIARLKAQPPEAPIIIAGVTRLDPIALELAQAVLALPNGAMVLPGLDQDMDEETWGAIVPRHPEHPQFGLAKLLAALGIARKDVQPLPGPAAVSAERARARLASETMRPAETTERWHSFIEHAKGRDMARALEGVSLLEAASAEEEADAVALMLREAVETPGRTAALVTPDRTLARRVSARLKTWRLDVPASSGTPFAKTPTGAFLDLVAEAVARAFEPVALVALLKHPLLRAGLAEREAQAGARTLELAVFRAPYFGRGIEGVGHALDRAQSEVAQGMRRHPSIRNLTAGDWKAARALVAGLTKATRTFAQLFDDPQPHALPKLVEAHVAAAQALSLQDALWHGPAGDWGARFFASLLEPDLFAPEMTAANYPDFYRALVSQKSIRTGGAQHPRLSIWDPFEARLQQPDLVILGALNESTWPAGAEPGPWLNRPMRASLSLPAPEEMIGTAAHDFASLLCAEKVVLTRAAKVDGAPTVPSRWLLRLEALRKSLQPGPQATAPWLAWAQARNAIDGPPRPVQAPAPRPRLALRPRKLSVTAVEKWIANPYGLYAQRILRLEPLAEIGRPPDAQLKGQIVHDALSRFARAFPDQLPDDIAGELMRLAEDALAELTGSPRVAAFWAPRFARFATWFAETEPQRRAGVARLHAEVDGAIVLSAPGGPFTLTARADRIDVSDAGERATLTITDYKTGAGIKELAKKAEQGYAPQLPLEAAIALGGGFAGLGPASVSRLRYISASGGEPPGQDCDLKVDYVTGHAKGVEAGLARLIAEFDNEATPYLAVRRQKFRYDWDEYAHLARVGEWSSESDAEEA